MVVLIMDVCEGEGKHIEEYCYYKMNQNYRLEFFIKDFATTLFRWLVELVRGCYCYALSLTLSTPFSIMGNLNRWAFIS